MTDLFQEIAEATGETRRVIRTHGFHLLDASQPSEPEALRIVARCPHCGRAADYLGRDRRGQIAMLECVSCDVYFEAGEHDFYLVETPSSPRLADDHAGHDLFPDVLPIGQEFARFASKARSEDGAAGVFRVLDLVVYQTGKGRRVKRGRVLSIRKDGNNPAILLIEGDDRSRVFRLENEVTLFSEFIYPRDLAI